MCGIFGHTQPADLKLSRRALKTLAHRGPDQTGEWHDDQVYLGHQRLSIMDISDAGRQPMTDGRVYITVNGEIYNYPELKAQLSSRYKFKSGSDSEVLIHGYHAWGLEGLLAKLEGMYAFVLYDVKIGKLWLVRDRVGIKPLYYGWLNNQLAWASELKALEAFYGPDLTIDGSAVYDYLTYIYVPAPKSLYNQVKKLEPAHYLEFDLASGHQKLKRYWELPTAIKKTDQDTAAHHLVKLLDQAVEQQLMSDVPIGFFLSGGLDSSAVVASAARHHNQLHTYSIGFDIKEHTETHYAELAAKAFGTEHVTREVNVSEVKKLFPKIAEWYDEPFADTSAFPTHLVSKLARPTATVVLTGDGGDEIFGGYNWYREFEKSVPSGGWRGKLKPGGNIDVQLAFYSRLMGGQSPEAKAVYKKAYGLPADYDDYWHFRRYWRTDLPLLTRLQYLDFHTYLPDDILTKVDRASMAVALECRVPLLATPLIEFMFSVPEDIRYAGGELKGLMKYALRLRLPKEILERDKKGFSIPTGRWQGDLVGSKQPMPLHILEKLFPALAKDSK